MTVTHPLLRLMRIDRPIGTWLLMWPALWALWLAGEGSPSLKNLLIFTFGVLVMRAAGCVINDYADRHLDGAVERTKNRPLAAGEVSERTALILFGGLMLLALLLVLMTNPLTIYLSFGGAALAASYPFMKRITHLPQFVLGAAWAWCVPMIFAAETGSLPAALWWLFAAIVCWTVAFDTYYAMVDRDDDVEIGIKSTAILFGRMDLAAIISLQIVALACLVVTGVLFERGLIYFAALTVAAIMFINQYRIGKTRDRDACFRAFLNNHRVGMYIFIGLGLDYLL